MDLVNNKTKDWISNTATTALLHVPTCNSSAPKPSLLLHACNQFVSAISAQDWMLRAKTRPCLTELLQHQFVSLSVLFNHCPPATFHPPDCSGSITIEHIHTLYALSSQHPTSLLMPNKQPEKQLPAGLKNRASSYK